MNSSIYQRESNLHICSWSKKTSGSVSSPFAFIANYCIIRASVNLKKSERDDESLRKVPFSKSSVVLSTKVNQVV